MWHMVQNFKRHKKAYSRVKTKPLFLLWLLYVQFSFIGANTFTHFLSILSFEWSLEAARIFYLLYFTMLWTSLVAQMVKHLSTMWETWVRSLGWEDSLEKEMATHSSTLALKIPWTEELGAGYYPWGCKESGTTERLHSHFHAFIQDSSQSFYGAGWLAWCQDYPKIHLLGEGPGAILWVFRHSSFINRLLVTIWHPAYKN